jgi:hypothetical protein
LHDAPESGLTFFAPKGTDAKKTQESLECIFSMGVADIFTSAGGAGYFYCLTVMGRHSNGEDGSRGNH